MHTHLLPRYHYHVCYPVDHCPRDCTQLTMHLAATMRLFVMKLNPKPRFANTRNCRNWGGGGGGGNTQRQLCFTGIIMIWKERRWREPWLFALLFFRELKIAFFFSSFFSLSKEKVSIEENFDDSIIVKIDFVENYRRPWEINRFVNEIIY